jgi:CHRD domain
MRKYFVNRKIDLLAVLSVVVVLLLSACGGSTSPPSSSPTATSTKAASSTTATATLKHAPTGTANITWTPTTHELTVKISLVGLAPNSTHPAHIHSGSCAKQGAIVYPLTNVVADSHGVGSSTTVIKDVKTLQPTGWYLQVHNGPGMMISDQSVPIVCSDLTFSNTSPTSTLSMQVPLTAAPASSPSESASGTAKLSLSGGTLTVDLMLTGLQPGTSHAAHIHTGSCESQGAVVYPLNNVVANSSGNYTGTTTIKNVSSIPGSGWYVNVHYSTNLSTQTGFNPIACGNVTLSK